MNPLQIFAAVKDGLIIMGVLALAIWLYVSGGSRIEKQDLQAVVRQVEANGKAQQEWQQRADRAQLEAKSDMDSLGTRIDAQRAPVIVRIPTAPSASPMPAAPATPAVADPGSGGIDIRPRINAFERKYEQALSDCRAAIASWP